MTRVAIFIQLKPEVFPTQCLINVCYIYSTVRYKADPR